MSPNLVQTFDHIVYLFATQFDRQGSRRQITIIVIVVVVVVNVVVVVIVVFVIVVVVAEIPLTADRPESLASMSALLWLLAPSN